MAQTAYLLTMALPFPGVIYDISPRLIESGVSAESSAEIPFGAGIKSDGVTESGVLLCTANTDVLRGIVIHSHAYDRINELGTVGIKPKVKVGVMRKGRIWVAVNASVTMVSRGFWNFSTGFWTPTAAAPNTIDATNQSVFRTLYTGSNGVAVIDVDFTNKP